MNESESMAKISYNQMAKLFNRLATSYSAGLDIRSVYTREANSGTGNYRLNAKRVLNGINQGLPLAVAMNKTEGYFPDLAIAVADRALVRPIARISVLAFGEVEEVLVIIAPGASPLISTALCFAHH